MNKRLEGFTPQLEVPYYVPCLYPLIFEKCKYEGMQTSVSLHANLQLTGLSSYLRSADLTVAQVGIYQANRLGFLGSEAYLKLQREEGAFESVEQGLLALQSNLDQNQISIVTGCLYYMPYSPNYQRVQYAQEFLTSPLGMVNHYLSVYGLSEREAFVYDANPGKYSGPVDLELLKQSWAGELSFPEIANAPGAERLVRYGYVDVRSIGAIKNDEIRELYFRTVKTVVQTHLEGPVLMDETGSCHYGSSVFAQLKHDFLSALEAKTPSYERLDVLANCVFDLRFTRYLFRDLLKDMGALFDRAYEEDAAVFQEVIDGVEHLSNQLTMRVKRRQAQLDNILPILESIERLLEREQRLFESLSNRHSQYLLLERRQD